MDELINKLREVLASSFTLYLKTHFFHWNVTGPTFPQLHQMFGDQYAEIWESIDVIAEDIRQLGAYAPGSFERYSRLSRIDDQKGIPPAPKMLSILVADHETMIDLLKEAIEVAESLNEQGIMDHLVERMSAHRKHLWFLKATAK